MMRYSTIIVALVLFCSCKKNNSGNNPSPNPSQVIRDTTTNAYGGPGDEGFVSTIILPEGGYLSAGYSNKNGDQVTGNHGDYDYWVVKTDTGRQMVWEKSFGGSASDKAIQMIRSSDGNYLILGTSLSGDGDRTTADGPIWVIKIDEAGNLIWQQGYGNRFFPLTWTATGIDNTPDGGFAFTSNVDNGQGITSGDITKADAQGTATISAMAGSTTGLYFNAVKAVSDGYVVTGQSNFSDGIHVYHGSGDLVVEKFGTDMLQKWVQTYGGSGPDKANAIVQTADQGFLIAGSSGSHDGDVVKNQGDLDWLICKLDAAGNLQWNTTLGGSGREEADYISATTDGNYLVSGFSASANGDVGGNQGLKDGWVVKIDGSGKIISQKTCGGSSDEIYGTAVETSTGHFIYSGITASSQGDVNGFHGNADGWIFRY